MSGDGCMWFPTGGSTEHTFQTFCRMCHKISNIVVWGFDWRQNLKSYLKITQGWTECHQVSPMHVMYANIQSPQFFLLDTATSLIHLCIYQHMECYTVLILTVDSSNDVL